MIVPVPVKVNYTCIYSKALLLPPKSMRSANLDESDLKITVWLEVFTVTEGLCDEEEVLREPI